MSAELEMLRSETELAEKVMEGSHQKAIILSSAGGRGQMHRVWLSMLKAGDNLTVTVRTLNRKRLAALEKLCSSL